MIVIPPEVLYVPVYQRLGVLVELHAECSSYEEGDHPECYDDVEEYPVPLVERPVPVLLRIEVLLLMQQVPDDDSVHHHQRDGFMSVDGNSGANPNYFPNSFDEIVPDVALR